MIDELEKSLKVVQDHYGIVSDPKTRKSLSVVLQAAERHLADLKSDRDMEEDGDMEFEMCSGAYETAAFGSDG